MKVVFAGGGTGGSVSPLLAIHEELKKQKPATEFLWLATRRGPEKKLLAAAGIPVKEIYAGKLRRYFSLKNIFDPFVIFFGLVQSFFIILQFKPQLIISAGGYVAVPVAWAGWLLRIPNIIHQQDVVPSLTNKILAPVAKAITVTFPKSVIDFKQKKTFLAGNPVRRNILAGDREQAYTFFKLTNAQPVVLVMGGGTGSTAINNLVLNSLQNLVTFCQVIHITGGKNQKVAQHSKYRSYDFLAGEMALAYAVADIVVSRAGMSALTEITALKKPAIIIPMPHSHQEANATEFFKKNAVTMLPEAELTTEKFVAAIKYLLDNTVEQQTLSRNLEKVMPEPQRAAGKILQTFL